MSEREVGGKLRGKGVKGKENLRRKRLLKLLNVIERLSKKRIKWELNGFSNMRLFVILVSVISVEKLGWNIDWRDKVMSKIWRNWENKVRRYCE